VGRETIAEKANASIVLRRKALSRPVSNPQTLHVVDVGRETIAEKANAWQIVLRHTHMKKKEAF
ncbi:MAG: hypothetical protein AAF587_14880, partial [Bacteroidota bacterium]